MKKRIALISEHASPLAVLGGVDSGGQNVYVAQIALHLAEMGHQVDVFTRREHADVSEIFPWENGIRVIHVPAGPAEFIPKEKLLPFMGEFTEYLLSFCRSQKEPYHLVHANFFMSGMVAMEIKRQLGIPFVITFHALGKVRRIYQGDGDAFPNLRFEIEEQIIAEADRIIAECPQDEEDLIQHYDANPDRISIVPCGFDANEVSPINKEEARLYLGLPLDESIILQLGRMVPRKGVDNVIRAVSRMIYEYGTPASLLIVGGDSDLPDKTKTPEIGRLESIAKEENVQRQVTFVGRRKRDILKYYYSAADVFVSTPWYEPFGITPIEAMACGTPVIGSNVGGIKYTVADGETGYLVEPKDPDALAERLNFLLENPDIAQEFRQNAIQRANEFFTWDKVSRYLVDIYDEVIRENQVICPETAIQLDLVRASFDEAILTIKRSQEKLTESILEAAQVLINSFSSGNKVMVCGNGGSAADAQHFAAELVGRFKKPGRVALPVMSLTADQAVLTAWANDTAFEDVFARQVAAFGRPGDVLIGISTSGQSQNVVQAFKAAKELHMTSIALSGGDGGILYSLADLPIVVPSKDTARIQEIHILLLHLVSELVEDQLLPSNAVKGPAYQATKMDWDLRLSLFSEPLADKDINQEKSKTNGRKSWTI